MKSQILAAVLAVPVVAASSFVAINADAFQGSESEELFQIDRSTITEQMTKLDNGYQMTVTTDNPDTLEALHAKVDRKVLKQSINRQVENLDNGVRITITSDNEEAVAKILERQENDRPEKEGVNVSTTQLENGVQVEITSDDPETVEKIQTKKEEGDRHGKKGKRGNR